MIGSLLGWWVGRVIERMQFPHQGEAARSVSDAVLSTFREGCLLGLEGYTYELFQKEALLLPWNLRAFFHEGRAMGAAGKSACSLRRVNPEMAATSNDYEVMRFVGYGFWNGVAGLYPVPKLSEDSQHWKDVSLYPKYRLLLANGAGFATVLFAGKFDEAIKRRWLTFPDSQKQEALFHGAGRALWFLYLNNFQALRDILSAHKDVAEPLGIGLGLAIAFTQVAAPEKILSALEEFPESQREHLIRGAGIAFQVHSKNDSECRLNVEKLLTGELQGWYEGACLASQEAGEGALWYPQYHKLTARFVGQVAVA